MAKIYFRKYLLKIEAGEMTAVDAIEDANVNVPVRWRAAVIELLEELLESEA